MIWELEEVRCTAPNTDGTYCKIKSINKHGHIPPVLSRPLKSLFSPRGDRLQQPACISTRYSPLGEFCIKLKQCANAQMQLCSSVVRQARQGTCICIQSARPVFCASTWPIKLFHCCSPLRHCKREPQKSRCCRQPSLDRAWLQCGLESLM